ncbi:MAG: hypothetical protein P8Y23_19020, partial [Candidatus Lokiarchaeota archaeon]
ILVAGKILDIFWNLGYVGSVFDLNFLLILLKIRYAIVILTILPILFVGLEAILTFVNLYKKKEMSKNQFNKIRKTIIIIYILILAILIILAPSVPFMNIMLPFVSLPMFLFIAIMFLYMYKNKYLSQAHGLIIGISFLLLIVATIILTPSLTLGFLYLSHKYLKKRGSSLKKILTVQFKFSKRLIRSKRIFCFFGIYLLLGGVVFTFYNFSNRIAFSRIHTGYSEWRDSNGELYLYINADNYYDLGYLTGKGLALNIALMKYELMISSLMFGIDYFSMINIAKQYKEYIPAHYLIELQGISDGASAGSGFYLSFEDVLVQSVFLEIIYGRLLPNISVSLGCTAFGTINSDNHTLIGQNIDLMKPMGACGAFVLHKYRNEPLTFTYRIGACTLPMGKNEHK